MSWAGCSQTVACALSCGVTHHRKTVSAELLMGHCRRRYRGQNKSWWRTAAGRRGARLAIRPISTLSTENAAGFCSSDLLDQRFALMPNTCWGWWHQGTELTQLDKFCLTWAFLLEGEWEEGCPEGQLGMHPWFPSLLSLSRHITSAELLRKHLLPLLLALSSLKQLLHFKEVCVNPSDLGQPQLCSWTMCSNSVLNWASKRCWGKLLSGPCFWTGFTWSLRKALCLGRSSAGALVICAPTCSL